ncbi:MAG TPA: coproporphyrinogen dehydrogenase HemZ, partial [Clostridia bacterium]|nr:coproporphyrinogen dehydrogenase HemZ [Clostridia bacterium]
SAHLMGPYVESLEAETRGAIEHMEARGYKIRSIYIGGGTPTSLPDELFERVLRLIPENSQPLEFTVEAGRPDTITPIKLAIMKENNVTRLSINPQSMNDITLTNIGRNHTAEDIYKAFELACEARFDHINADLIAGLPGEGMEEFAFSLDEILNLGADNITVHTLALKRGSFFNRQDMAVAVEEKTADRMVELARQVLTSRGYRPYYLYRQKYMTGSLENVGYALPGTECLYNPDMMEETAHIIACGSGGISKRIYFDKNRIERAPNVKNIKEYIDRTDEMLARKKALFGS